MISRSRKSVDSAQDRGAVGSLLPLLATALANALAATAFALSV
jgi:hypothetical protein